MTLRIDQIRARLAAATPGPWTRDEIDSLAGPCRDEDHYESDRLFIAHAPQDLRDLLALYDAVKVDYADNTSGQPFDDAAYARYHKVKELLFQLDSPVGDEGAE